jgi:hypothetical protein
MIRVRTVFSGVTGSPYYSNLYFAGSTDGEAQVAVTAVDAFWTGMSEWMCTPMAMLIEGSVPQIDPATGDILQVFSVGDETSAATSTSEAAPLASQILIQWRTGDYIAGRELRGRTFVPYIDIGAINDGVIASGARSSVLSDANTLLSAAAGAGGLVVWSRTHGQASAISNASVWNQLAVMRSRRD